MLGTTTTPSGEDTLNVRRSYLRKQRSRRSRVRRLSALRMVALGVVCSLCVAGFAVFVLGS
jgi:hypothetical protein